MNDKHRIALSLLNPQPFKRSGRLHITAMIGYGVALYLQTTFSNLLIGKLVPMFLLVLATGILLQGLTLFLKQIWLHWKIHLIRIVACGLLGGGIGIVFLRLIEGGY